jgi:transposase InsO family protein
MKSPYAKNKLAGNPKLRKEGADYYLGDKKVIPAEDVQEFLKRFYDNPETGMRGRDSLYAKISREYVGISRRTVAAFLANQETAQVHKEVPAQPITRPAVLRKEGQWAVDLTWLKRTDPAEDNLKDSQILFTCIDQFSKYAWVRILPNKQGGTVAKAMQAVIDDSVKVGTKLPRLMRSDNGSEFISAEFKAVLAKIGCKQRFSEPHNPRQNAMIERFNKTIKSMIYKYMTQWNVGKIDDAALQKLVSNYNSTKHSTTESTPADIHKPGADPVDAKLAHSNMQIRAKKLVAENKSVYPVLEIGDQVRVARRTIPSWRATRTLKKYAYMKNWTYEIFIVSAKTRGSTTKAITYTLKDDKGVVLAQADNIPKQFTRQDLQKVDSGAVIKELEKGHYVVEKVIDKGMVGGKPKYLVQWRGHDDTTWEFAQPGFQKLIDEYELSIKKPRKVNLAKK